MVKLATLWAPAAKFVGLFVLRRSDSYWAGIFSDDLYIEQVLMGSVKWNDGVLG